MRLQIPTLIININKIMLNNFAKFSHPIYKQATSLKTADAVGWAFTSPKTIEKIAFNFPDLGKDEVRANVLYCGLCHSDTLMSRSQWFKDLDYPIVAGHEIVAEVTQVGSQVSHLKKGDKVGFGFLRDHCGECKCCKSGHENTCTSTTTDRAIFGHHFGGFATQIQQPEKWFFKLPEKTDLARAGPLLCAGITVYQPISNWIRRGDKTAVLGIGGLGHMAIQYLSKMGHEVTAFNNYIDYKDLMIQLGAKDVICTKNEEEFSKHMGKFDFVVNTVPKGDAMKQLINVCAPQARFIQVGLPDGEDPLIIPHIPLVFNEIQIIGSIVGTSKKNKEMLDFSSKHNVYPITEEWKFEEFKQAVDKIENGKPKFRIVVNVMDYAKANGLYKI